MKSKLFRGLSVCLLVPVLALAACAPNPSGTPGSPLPTAVVNTTVPTAQPSEILPSATQPPIEDTLPVPTLPALEDATVFPDPTLFAWQLVADGLKKPTDLAAPEDGSGRLLILEQGGVIRVIADGELSAEPFFDLTDRVGADGSEQGLLGIALDPEYADNGIFYLNYTDKNGDTVIARYHSMSDGFRGDPASEEILLQVDQPYANHNGGDLEFGPDGMLYIGLGDGGSGGDPQGNAQNPNALLGKMLRLDVRGKDAYTIPADNPYASGGGRQEIWAVGLRNPWRYTFDSLTGDLYIADVGQNKYEEVHYLPAGSQGGVNFGWNYREGAHPYEGNAPDGANLIDPVFEYDHGQGCSITGGYVYRGQALPEFYGIYLVSDYCSGNVWGLMQDAGGQWQSQLLFQVAGNISSFGQDTHGEIYLLDHRTGGVFRLERKQAF